MILEAVAGVAGETPAAFGLAPNGLRPDHSHRREWLERGQLISRSAARARFGDMRRAS